MTSYNINESRVHSGVRESPSMKMFLEVSSHSRCNCLVNRTNLRNEVKHLISVFITFVINSQPCTGSVEQVSVDL